MKDQIPDAPSPPPAVDLTPDTSSLQPNASQDKTNGSVTSNVGDENEPRKARDLLDSSLDTSKDAIPEASDTSLTSPPAALEETHSNPTPTPTVPTPRLHVLPPQIDQTRQAPMWIDALIVVGLAVLVTMLYRKIGNSSNLIETVSL